MAWIAERFAAFRSLAKECDSTSGRLTELRCTYGGVSAPSTSSVPQNAGTYADRTSITAIQLHMLEETLQTLTKQYRQEYRAITALLQTKTETGTLLSVTERQVLSCTVLDSMTTEQTAEVLDMSPRGVRYAYKRGVMKLDEHFTEVIE